MQITIDINEFISSATSTTAGDQTKKHIETMATVVDGEILVLGGLIKNKTSETLTKVPILGDIPLIGWLFKNKSKEIDQSNLLVFIVPRILPVNNRKEMGAYTLEKDRKSVV